MDVDIHTRFNCYLSTFYGMWTLELLPAMKSQDILLLFKMVSLHVLQQGGPEGLGLDLSADGLEIASPDRGDSDNSCAASPLERIPHSYTLRALSESLGLSKSEISNSLARCREAGLLTTDYESLLPSVNRRALLSISEHALKYFFPVKPGALTRGIPTGFASPVLAKHLKSAGDQILVWPDPHGKAKGQGVEPLYKTVPYAVKQDRLLYHYLALVDAIRLGGPRESAVAIKILKTGMGL